MNELLKPRVRWGRAISALTLLVVAACGSRGSAARDARPDSTASSPAASVYDATHSIAMERGACFGQCPVYAVAVRGDGLVQFDGRAFVADSGAHEAQLDPGAVRDLFARFDSTAFATADSAYVEGAPNCGPWVTDAPQLTLRRTQGTDTHTVRLDAGCTSAPRWLTTLAAAVDSTAGTDRWITSSPSQP